MPAPRGIDELIDGLGCAWLSRHDPGAQVTGVADDSRFVQPGDLFVARRGPSQDGSTYINEAVAAGAAAVLLDERAAARSGEFDVPAITAPDTALALARIAERIAGHPSSSLNLVAVTGTNGKSTVAHFVRALLTSPEAPCGLIGTIEIDDGAESRQASLTTPGAVELSAILRKMVDHRCASAVVEASSHAIEQQRTAGLDIDVAVFTNLSGDHLDYHGDMERYADAKAGLFSTLSSDAKRIVNIDDHWAERVAGDSCAGLISCSLTDQHADFRVVDLRLSMHGIACDLVHSTGTLRIESNLVGRHNVMNLMQAIAVAIEFGVSPEEIEARVRALTPPRGRLERVPVDGSSNEAETPIVLVDYAHTDDALRSTMTALRRVMPKESRLIAVFGCGGDRDRTKRPRMGGVVAELADVGMITSDNPRSESPEKIIDEIERGIPADTACLIRREADRDRAITRALEDARPGDVVLIAGKGHEDYQLISDDRGVVEKRPMDDRLMAEKALVAWVDRSRSSCQ